MKTLQPIQIMSGAVFLRQTVYTLILYADVFQGNCGSTVFKSYIYILNIPVILPPYLCARRSDMISEIKKKPTYRISRTRNEKSGERFCHMRQHIAVSILDGRKTFLPSPRRIIITPYPPRMSVRL